MGGSPVPSVRSRQTVTSQPTFEKKGLFARIKRQKYQGRAVPYEVHIHSTSIDPSCGDQRVVNMTGECLRCTSYKCTRETTCRWDEAIILELDQGKKRRTRFRTPHRVRTQFVNDRGNFDGRFVHFWLEARRYIFGNVLRIGRVSLFREG